LLACLERTALNQVMRSQLGAVYLQRLADNSQRSFLIRVKVITFRAEANAIDRRDVRSRSVLATRSMAGGRPHAADLQSF